jgi:glycosyltransferase involved in cell wall biosynthesis
LKYREIEKRAVRIIHIVSGDLWAGKEVQVYQTIRGMHTDRNLSFACVLFNQGSLEEKLKSLGIDIFVLDESLFSSFQIILKLKRVLQKWQPDIIHSHHIKEHFLSALTLRICGLPLPVIRTVHGLNGVPAGLPLKKHLRSSFVVGLDDFLVKYMTNTLIAVSKDLAFQLKNKRPRAKIEQVYNAIDLSSVSSMENRDNKTALRDHYRVGHRFWIGTAARLVATKNIDILIESAEKLLEKDIPFKISVFGEGPLKNILNQKIEASGLSEFVELHGFLNHILPVMAAMDVFVICSGHEGLPMSLLEAMAVKTPVVCTAVGGMKEVVSHGINGLFIRPNDANDLASKLAETYFDPTAAKCRAVNGRRTVLGKFSIEHLSKTMSRIYRHCVGQKL